MAGKTRVSGMSNNGGKKNYFQNLAKEIGDLGSAWSRGVNASMDARSYPPGKREKKANQANRLRNKQDKEFGQVLGALLQGRRYNRKGEQI